MSRSNQSPYLALTSSYAIALSVIAIMFVGANVLLERAVEDQRKVPPAVEMTGRQSMLAQRIAWLADRYSDRGEQYSRQQLQAAITDLAVTADALRTAADREAVPPGVAKVYADQNINTRLRAFLAHARVIAATDITPGESGQQAVNEHMNAIIAEAYGPLLTGLTAVSSEYTRESEAQIARLQTAQYITLAVILLTLAAEALFVFRPLVGKVSNYVEEVLEHSRRAGIARRAAQHANAAKTAFLSNMSHELRTPMTGIMGICDLLTSSHQPPEQAKMTRMLRQSAQILLDLLNDILDLSKIEAGRMSLESIDFDLGALLADVRNLFDPGMAEKGLAFTVEGAGQTGAVFRGDPKHIRQILCNLVGNALKFTDSGSVKLSYRQEEAANGIILTFAVADTGIGISEEGLTRLFRKFEQEETSTSRRYGGTGLGLAICKQLSEAMGGGIEVKSTKGLGSTFLVRVQVQQGDPNAVIAAADAVPVRAGDELSGLSLNILLAEDNLTTQFILTRMLTMWGQNVTAVGDGRAAMQRAAQERFDIILIDMQMPVMDGDEATRRIRAGGASSDVPIVALTADGITEHHRRYLDAGCDVVLTKPVVWSALAHQLRALTGHGGEATVAGPPLARDTTRPAVLNAEMLDGLREVLAPQDFEDLVRQFLVSLDTYRKRLGADIAAGDHANARRTAHTLKGQCAQMGADEVAQLAAWIEDESPDAQSVAAVLPRLDEGVARAKDAILETVPDLESLS